LNQGLKSDEVEKKEKKDFVFMFYTCSGICSFVCVVTFCAGFLSFSVQNHPWSQWATKLHKQVLNIERLELLIHEGLL